MTAAPGIVYLVGAGPGDPELITVRGRKLLRAADAIVHDRLIGLELLALARRDAEIIDVGKVPGAHRVRQEEINTILIDRARAGRCVVRLKGGDPFVFGRGFEEYTACREADVECIVVPGVSSALAAPLAAGVSVTARGVSRAVTIITAETAEGDSPIDFAALSDTDTLVILMGRARLSEIVRSLMQVGKDPSTPAACIERATFPSQRVVAGTLATIAELVDQAGLDAPIVTVIGETARFAEAQRGTSIAPLAGMRILNTRPRGTSSELNRTLLAAGARVISCPLIRIAYDCRHASFREAVSNLSRFAWIVFTSQHGVTGFYKGLVAAGLDARAVHPCKLAVVGPATQATLRRYALTADLVAETQSGDALAESMLRLDPAPREVLYPRGDVSLRSPVERLRLGGVEVTEVVVYRNQPRIVSQAARARIEDGVDAILFFSPSAARSFVENGLTQGDAIVACIGPTTASTANDLGLRVDVVAAQHSAAGLVQALVEHVQAVGVGP